MHVQSIVLLPGHIQIVLEEATLTCLRLPHIQVGASSLEPTAAGWLEAMWRLVGQSVTSAELAQDDKLAIAFDKTRLQLDLREGEDHPLEIAVLHLATGEEMVF